MKKITLFAILLLLSIAELSAARQQAYKVQLKMTDVKDSLVYLVHYYGKGRPTIFITDSTYLDHSGNATFTSTDSAFVGGIYIILLGDKERTNFEFLLNRGDDIGITATKSKLPDGVRFKNSPENDRFEEYVDYLKGFSAEQDKLKEEIKKARTAADTEVIRKKSIASSKTLTNYRRDYVRSHPGTLLSAIFNAMEVPDIPEGTHYLEDGKTKDSTYAYRYYKAHYWDGFNFRDDRLIYTPLYDPRIEEYMTKLVVPWPDSMEKEADILLRKTKGTKDMFHYTLWWLTHNVENSKVMGMDEVFVYLVENYYMKGDAFWLTNEELGKYYDRAQKIAPNVIGNVAPEIKLPNVVTKKEESMHALKGKYTVVVFYSPNCGHCQHEMPELDSLYKAVLKERGVKMYTVATETDDTTIQKFIKKNNMQEWTNTWDPNHTSDYHNKYDVYSTPTIYLLDEKKIIRGKRLDHSNLGSVIEMLEKKAKEKNKEKGTKTSQ
jgi:thiol-disulfide isomerase/thioredoxin